VTSHAESPASIGNNAEKSARTRTAPHKRRLIRPAKPPPSQCPARKAHAPCPLTQARLLREVPRRSGLCGNPLASRDVRLDKLEKRDTDDAAGPVLAAAHVYQVGSAPRRDRAPNFTSTPPHDRPHAGRCWCLDSGVSYERRRGGLTDAGILWSTQAAQPRAVAEHALGMLIALSKRIPENQPVMRRERLVDRVAYIGNDVLGQDHALSGSAMWAAAIAQAVPQVCSPCGAGLTIPISRSRCAPSAGPEKVALRRPDAPQRLCVRATARSPRRPAALVGATQLALMRKGAYLISTARGHIHDEQRSPTRWQRQTPAPASTYGRPSRRPATTPLLRFDNVLISPHTAGVTRETRYNMGRSRPEQVLDARGRQGR